MPRLAHSLPKYCKHKASGQAVVKVFGRYVYLGPYNTKTSKLEYDRVVAEWLAAGRPSQTITPHAEISVAEVMVAYLRHVKQRYVKNGNPTSEQHGIKSVLRRIRKIYSKSNAIEFGPLSLKAVRQQMVDDGLARSSINQNMGRIKRMFRWAASEELIPAAVYQSLSTVNGLRKGELNVYETAPIKPVADEYVEKTLPYLTNTLKAMIQAQRYSGMRPGEIVIMRPCDIDQTNDIWQYTPNSHKTEHHGRERVIPIGPKCQSVISLFLLRPAESYCFTPHESEAQRFSKKNSTLPETLSITIGLPKPIQKKGFGEHYATSSYRCAIARACRKAKIPVWKPNQLRHAAATEIRKKFGLEAAQVVLGHAAADITQVYAERDATLAIQIAKEIG
jgi:integrase